MTTRKMDITRFDRSQVSNLQAVLDDMSINGARIRYEKVVPTTSTMSENEIVIYDNGSGTKIGYVVTREGNLMQFGGTSEIPAGGIIMWSGTIATIPTGWVLCDGNNSTPDLTNRSIVGADADDSGAAKSTITGSALQSSDTGVLPAHTHVEKCLDGGAPIGYGVQGNAVAGATEHTGYVSTYSTGTGTDVISVFYALAYIMKS